MEKVKKIVVIGPESTGKSILCEKLARHFDSCWVPEYAREYLEKYGPAYTYEDLLTIAKGQINSEEKIENAIKKKDDSPFIPDSSTFHHQPLFIDTDLYVMKVWNEFVFNKCHNWILNRIAERQYDLYLLCNIDLTWVEDPLREHPDHNIRQKLFLHYHDMMINQSVPWKCISGDYEERFSKAIAAVEKLFL